MKLVSFTIQNYRSIAKAEKIPAGAWTVLIGPNNEGKSNILKGLATALEFISRQQRYRSRVRGAVARSYGTYARGIDYEWDRDFPLSLQEAKPNGESIFLLEFELTQEEVRTFKSQVGSRLNGTLPIRLAFGRDSVAFRVAKRGPRSQALSQKVTEIASFISAHLELEYIPAVRTAQSARRIVEDMVTRALRSIEAEPRYQAALAEIAAIETPILAGISTNVTATLQEFLPDVTSVSVSISEEARYGALRRSCQLVVDDGNATELQFKGDGVQSLAALSLMRYASEKGALGRNLVLAIEEPESHLHPRAIHQLRRVLRDIAENRQLVMTTHNPLFVDRMTLRNNIVVTGNRAGPASNIREIREMLGVRAADNLRNADLVVLCEGESDRLAIEAVLAHDSEPIRHALDEGILAFDSLLGGTNLSYKLGQLRDSLCLTHVVLDDDVAGRLSAQRALDEGLADYAEFTMMCRDGSPEAEIEDLYDIDVYRNAIETKFGVSLTHARFRTNRKWSERMRAAFRAQGAVWSDQVAVEVKEIVASAVAARPGESLHPATRGPFDGLRASLERKLEQLMTEGR